MRADCRSGIQSSGELNGFWEKGIVEEMCFNKIRFAGALAPRTSRFVFFSPSYGRQRTRLRVCSSLVDDSVYVSWWNTNKRLKRENQINQSRGAWDRAYFSGGPSCSWSPPTHLQGGECMTRWINVVKVGNESCETGRRSQRRNIN